MALSKGRACVQLSRLLVTLRRPCLSAPFHTISQPSSPLPCPSLAFFSPTFSLLASRSSPRRPPSPPPDSSSDEDVLDEDFSCEEPSYGSDPDEDMVDGDLDDEE